MKIYKLLMVLFCIPGLVRGMHPQPVTLDDNEFKRKIELLYDFIDSKDNIVSQLNNLIQTYNYLIHSADYNRLIKTKYIELFNNTGLSMLGLPNQPLINLAIDKLDERNLSLLLHNFLNFLYKKIAYHDNPVERFKNVRVTQLFDELIALRLECAKCLPEHQLRKSILDFSPLMLSRWNPFGWGNWYDRLHRTVSSLPSMPWDEWNPEDTNRILVQEHLNHIQGNMNNYGASIKTIAQIYVCIMRELRILIKDNLTPIGRSRLRGVATGIGLIGAFGLSKYLFSGKKNDIKKRPSHTVLDYLPKKH